MSTWKEQKEAFVTGHDGTTPLELLLVCISAPLGVWLYQLLQPRSEIGAIAVEATVLLFPMALCQTSLLYPWGLVILILGVAFGGMLTLMSKHVTLPKSEIGAVDTDGNLGFVSSYRASVMYLTFVAILAVDFHVFPRRFAKTETSGYGLMDVGAGSFVVAAGLVSPRARGTGKILSGKAVQRMLPLLALGVVRLLTTKGLDYQEHVSEYGIHWNFFFTLAALSPLAAVTPCAWQIPMGIMAVYQVMLNRGVQQYIEEAPRKCNDTESSSCTFFAANREGILGVVGYLVLFQGSELIGKFCVWNHDANQRVRLVIASICLWMGHQILVLLGIRASRRSTNATFCVWTLAHNVTLLSLLCIASVKNKVPPIFNAVNRNGLLVFLIANLLTGMVNLSMNTLAASDQLALFVVFLYLCTVGGLSLIIEYVLSNYIKAKND